MPKRGLHRPRKPVLADVLHGPVERGYGDRESTEGHATIVSISGNPSCGTSLSAFRP
ncbi:protein of unknown function [Methylocaldum szegediense]|uniref:Uncharacterized protein n=1 Tax=Methylocaldum szegediense TaxID=73780 RepID=A0ABM9I708_9GAMM|nr:protein of unknown function [Methylocaldum szegediense]